MPINLCPECKGKVSHTLARCPHCGYEMDFTRTMSSPATSSPDAPRISRGWIALISTLCVVLAILLGILLWRWLNPGGETSEGTENKEENITVQDPTIVGKDSFHMTGTLGGDASSWLDMDGKTGRYRFTNYERKVRLTSYNESTGALKLEAVDESGSHIGTFSGRVSRSGSGTLSYSGTFTNYKGYEIPFNYHTR